MRLRLTPKQLERAPSEEEYSKAVEEWVLCDAAQAEDFYAQTLFPLSCARIAAKTSQKKRRELLFVPVGTQPFAPILAVLGTPADCVALLESKQAQQYGDQVEAALREVTDATFVHVTISPSDVVDIAQAMKAVWETRGLPSGEAVAADITGGRKPTTAAVAGVGSSFGWDLFYVEGKQVRTHGGYSHSERIVRLANVLDVFGRVKRERALDLLAAGACAAAAGQLEAIVEESGASARDEGLLAFARAARAFRRCETGDLAVALEACGQTLELDECVFEMIDAARSARDQESASARAGLFALAAAALGQEGWPHESAAALCRALENLEAPKAGDAETSADALLRDPRLGLWEQALAALDGTVGRGLQERVESLR